MSGNSKSAPPGRSKSVFIMLLRHTCSTGEVRRLAALVTLTLREAIRSRVLLGMVGLVGLFAAGSLLWPGDVDRERVILVQRFCLGALTLFGLIAAAFLGGSTLPGDIDSKRIYSVITKPVTRLELLLGKALGLIAVMFVFLLLGGLVTVAVTHVASARKSYAGGSYTLEVTAPDAEIQTETGPVPARLGQELVADGKTGTRYAVTIARRDTSISGTIPKSSVELHERSLDVLRVAEPASLSVLCKGRADFSHTELLLRAGRLAQGDTWRFDLSGLRLPTEDRDIDVRFRFTGHRYEPLRGREAHPRPQARFIFRNPATRKKVTKEVEFVFREGSDGAGAPRGRSIKYYEEVFALPRSVTAGGTLDVEITDYAPAYPESGRTYYGSTEQPTWLIRGFDPGKLPQGQQTIRARFLVHYTRGLDLVDHTGLTVEVRNPATGESKDLPVDLRSKTTSYIHFPRRLIDGEAGVEVTLKDLRPSHRIGYKSKECPLYLLLTPDSFLASTARSILLIFFQLSLFTVLAAAASTLLSAPVAILFTMVVALSGGVKDLIVQGLSQAQLAAPGNPFVLAAHGEATLQEGAWTWLKYIFTKLLIAVAPSFDRFSSTYFVNRGWTVPWSAVFHGACYALIYIAVCFCLGCAFLKTREFE